MKKKKIIEIIEGQISQLPDEIRLKEWLPDSDTKPAQAYKLGKIDGEVVALEQLIDTIKNYKI